jgi:hypothetical protein
MGELLSDADKSPEGQLFGRLSGHLAQDGLSFGSYTGSPQDRLKFGGKLIDFFFIEEEERDDASMRLYEAARHCYRSIGTLVAKNNRGIYEALEAWRKKLYVAAAEQELHKECPPVALGQQVLRTIHAGDWQEPVKDALAAVILAAMRQNEAPQEGGNI